MNMERLWLSMNKIISREIIWEIILFSLSEFKLVLFDDL
jgi:hypothetical protein